MIKLKAGDLRKIAEGLREILQKEIPMKPAYWLGRIANKVTPELKVFEDTRISLLKKHTKKDKKGNLLFKKDEKGEEIKPQKYDIADEEALVKEFEELAAQEIEINFNPIKLEDIDVETCEKCGRKKGNIKPAILAKLENIIVI